VALLEHRAKRLDLSPGKEKKGMEGVKARGYKGVTRRKWGSQIIWGGGGSLSVGRRDVIWALERGGRGEGPYAGNLRSEETNPESRFVGPIL